MNNSDGDWYIYKKLRDKVRREMNRYCLLLVVLFPLFMGCNGTDAKIENVEKKERVEKPSLPELEGEKKKQNEEDMLNQLGFELKDEKIIIDMNKTANFFEMLERRMADKAKEIESKITNAEINVTEEIGVNVEGNSVEIDLNKTKNMLEKINVLMKDIFLDINGSKPYP